MTGMNMMKSKRTYMMAASLLVMLSVSACQHKATGQVVAVVNGEEITQQEINAELTLLKIPDNANKKLVQRQALERLIERRLIANAARDDGIDKDQEFLIRKRQMEDGLLANLIGERAQRTFRIPDAAAIDKYIASRPMLFKNRLIYQVDRIQFPTPADPKKLAAFSEDHSMTAVAARLKAMGITFNRTAAQFDSASMPQDLMKKILALPPGEPFGYPEAGTVSIAVITGSTPAPMTNESMRPIAVQLMRRDAVIDVLKERLNTQKAAAKIEYQPGFEPTKAEVKG